MNGRNAHVSARRTGAVVAVGSAAVAAILAAGCGVDSSLQSGDGPRAQTYTLLMEVQPTSSLRTEDTWGRWTTPIQVTFVTDFETGAVTDDGHDEDDSGEHVDDDGHTEKRASGDTVGEDGHVLVGRTTVDDIAVRVESRHARTLWRPGHEVMTAVEPLPGETHHLMVYLEDAAGGHEVHGHANVPGADVRVELTVEGQPQEIELRPVQGAHGFRYEANAAVLPGVYDVTVHVSPPELLRDEDTKDRWPEAIEAVMAEFEVGEGEAATVVEGLSITLRTRPPKAYAAMGMGTMALAGDEAVSFSVRLEDPDTEVTRSGEMIANSVMRATIIHDATGAAVTRTLEPMYGSRGFHFGTNVPLPGDDHDDDGDDHDDDGDDHDDDGDDHDA